LTAPLVDVDPISFIEEIEEAYIERHGASPVHLSHWDPARAYREVLNSALRLPRGEDAFRYWFTYEMQELKSAVGQRLALTPGSGVRLFTNSSTVSTIAVVHWLRNVGVRRMVILAPFYFSVLRACDALGVACEIVPLTRHFDGDSTRYRIPTQLPIGDGDCLWVTNPVYSSGGYISGARDELSSIADGTFVVLDETLSDSSLGLAQTLSSNSRIVALHSPHKGLNINGVKFSCVIGTEDCQDHLDQWSDVLTGGLAASAVTAIRHFLSPNFETCCKEFRSFTRVAHLRLRQICNSSGAARFDDWESGNFVACYSPLIDGGIGFSSERMNDLVEKTASIVFPTACSFADPAWGFGFRLNLTRFDQQFSAAFRRLVSYLSRRPAALGR